MAREPKGYIYFAVTGPLAPIGGFTLVKIGWPKDPEARVADLQTGCPYPLQLALALPAWRHLEYLHHLRFSSLAVRETGEWFHLRGELTEYLDYLFFGGPLLGMEKEGQIGWHSSEWGPRQQSHARTDSDEPEGSHDEVPF